MARSSAARTSKRVLWALLGSSIFPLAVACRDITGLADYKTAECNGGDICSDAEAFDGGPQKDGSTRDVVNDVTTIDAEGTKPVSWAHFKMPSWDGGPPFNLPDYTAATDSVQDNITLRVWLEQKPPAVAPKTYKDAVDYCASASGGWRLPSRIELVTLLALDPASPTKIDTKLFPSTVQEPYWTSSELRPFNTDNPMYWTVNFGTGEVVPKQGVATARVRCVKDK